MSSPVRSSAMTRLYRSASSRAVTPSASACTWIGVPCSSVPLTISTGLPHIRWYRANMSHGRPKPDTWPMWRGPFAYGQAAHARMWRLVITVSLGESRSQGRRRTPSRPSAPGDPHALPPGPEDRRVAADADVGVRAWFGAVPQDEVQTGCWPGQRAVRWVAAPAAHARRPPAVLGQRDLPLADGVGSLYVHMPPAAGSLLIRQPAFVPAKEPHDQLVDPVGREGRLECCDRPARCLLGVDAVDRRLVRLAARPERQRRRGRQERPAG